MIAKLVSLSVLLSFSVSARVYKCTNIGTGEVIYSNVDCPDRTIKKTLNIIENDYNSERWKRIDRDTAAKKDREALIEQARRDALDKTKAEDIARVERLNTERYRVFQSNKFAFEQTKIRNLPQRVRVVRPIGRHRQNFLTSQRH